MKELWVEKYRPIQLMVTYLEMSTQRKQVNNGSKEGAIPFVIPVEMLVLQNNTCEDFV